MKANKKYFPVLSTMIFQVSFHGGEVKELGYNPYGTGCDTPEQANNLGLEMHQKTRHEDKRVIYTCYFGYVQELYVFPMPDLNPPEI